MKKILENKVRVALVAGVAVVASVCLSFVKQPGVSNSDNKLLVEITKKRNAIKTPLQGVDLNFSLFSVDASKGTKINFPETASVITIPADAFVDKTGKVIKGSVEIKYREFRNPVDFFVGGVPMTYDSAGVQYQFESAGMLEILAFKNGEPVFMNPEKRVVVEMVSLQANDKYNIYQFDTVANKWNYLYHDNSAVAIASDSAKKNEIINLDAALSKLSNEGSDVLPLKMNPTRFHFKVKIDSTEFPELTAYENVQFEVDKNEKGFSPAYANEIWSDASVERGKRKGAYKMTLSKGTQLQEFETIPVLAENDYEAALSNYKSKLVLRKNKEKKLQRLRDSLFTRLNNQRLNINQQARLSALGLEASAETQNMVVRVFTLNGFGIWNSDCPSSLPKGELFVANYKDSLGNKLLFSQVYLVEKGRNAMFTIYTQADTVSTISFNPKKKNMLWAVTKDNRLAVVDVNSFEKIKIKEKQATVTMKLTSHPVKSKVAIESLLKI